jgi:tRNA pseudouridine(38-40) synthase
MAGVRKRLCCDSKRTRLLFSDTRGSQKQRAEVVTVESQLEQALLRAGLVLPSNLTRERMHWEASSRTDAGVHSVSLLISAKLELHEREWQVGDAMAASPAVIARINRHLPPTVRVFAAQRVGDAFGARRNTTHREYIYFLPEQAFGGKLVEAGVDRINNVIRTFVGTHYWRSYTRLRHIDDRPVDTRYVYDLAGVLARAAPSLGKWLPLFLPNFQRSNAQVSPALPPPPEQTGEVNAQEALFGVRTLMDTIRLRNLDRRRDDAALATPDAPALSDSELLSALSATYAQDEALLVKRCCEMLRHQRNTNLFRSVLNVKCERVRIAERDWFALHVLGESFVYHQIRHIVG